MLFRFYLKDYLSFDEIDIEFKKGLNIFTGPSGAGKSIFMNALLGNFALKGSEALLSEVSILNSLIENENFGIEKDEDIVIKQLKKEKIRYFINSQTVSKKALKEFAGTLVNYLHLKDTSDFKSSRLLELADIIIKKEDSGFESLKEEYIKTYTRFNEVLDKLQKIEEEESQIEELKEFAKFEIEKISSIDPKADEYDKLNEIKKMLSRKDKIEEALNEAGAIFELGPKVSGALELLESDTGFFDDCMNELENIFERSKDELFGLEEIDIEETLTRIEKLSSLNKRFGSIEKALEYKFQKEQELQNYENITFEKSKLIKEKERLSVDMNISAEKLTQKRTKALKILEERINKILGFLYLSNASFKLERTEFGVNGRDSVVFRLLGVDLNNISSGEFNRLRLALLNIRSEYELCNGGILFLDEIDANLSGKESEAIAAVLSNLGKYYQIFAISHQPQLTSKADQHFLIEKLEGISTIRELGKKQRVDEISRMISGEHITKEAKEFAQNLLKD